MVTNTSEPVYAGAAVDAENATLDGWRAFWAKWHEDNFRAPDMRREPELWHLSRLGVFGYAPPNGADFFASPNGHIGTGGVDFLKNALNGVDGGICTRGIRGFDALRSFVVLWLYATRDAEPSHLALAAAVVEAKSPGLTEEQGDRARRALGQELADRCRSLAAFIGWDWPGLPKLPKPVDGWDVVDIGGLDIGASLDAVAGFLEDIGPEGKKAANGARKIDPVALWADPAGPKTAPDGPTRSPLMWALACVLWADVVKPALASKAAREAAVRVQQGRAALVAPVHSQIGDALWPARLDAKRGIVSADGQLSLPFVVTSVQSDLPVEVLGSETAQRFVRWVIRAAAAADSAQCYAPIPDAPGVTVTRLEGGGVEVAIVGGIRRLAEVIGAKSKKAEGDVSDTLSVLSHVHLREMFTSLRGGSGGVLIHCPDEERGRGGGVRKLTFIVHPILCPGAVKAFHRALSGEDRILTPVLSPPVIPAGFERGTTPAALFRLEWAVGRFLARHRRAVKAQGGAFVPWEALAKAAGVTPKALQAALLLWFAPGPIQRFEGQPGGLCMYASGGDPEAAAARAFILDGADKVEARALKGAKGRAVQKAKSTRKTRGRSPP